MTWWVIWRRFAAKDSVQADGLLLQRNWVPEEPGWLSRKTFQGFAGSGGDRVLFRRKHTDIDGASMFGRQNGQETTSTLCLTMRCTGQNTAVTPPPTRLPTETSFHRRNTESLALHLCDNHKDQDPPLSNFPYPMSSLPSSNPHSTCSNRRSSRRFRPSHNNSKGSPC